MYYKRLCAFSMKYGVDNFDAEEITENTFIKIWQNRQKIDTIKNPKSYLYKMVSNASYDCLKKNKKNIPFDIDRHDSSTIINETITEDDVHYSIYKALDNLPAKCRKVFELSCLEGLKYKEIAEDLEISINTVKSQRARAIELLRGQLKNIYFIVIYLIINVKL